MKLPYRGLPALPTIHTLSLEAIGLGLGVAFTAAASATYAFTNRAHLIPFHINFPITVTKLFSVNGATASGNIDVGIYSADLTRIVSAGSTAQAGTNAVQVFDITDTILGAGDFYLAIAMDNTTGTVFRATGGVANMRRAGMLQMNTAFPLPTTITPASVTQSFAPMIGLRQRGTVL